jgi:hypothetical protein
MTVSKQFHSRKLVSGPWALMQLQTPSGNEQVLRPEQDEVSTGRCSGQG